MKINWKSLGAAAITLTGVLAQNAGAFGKAGPALALLGLVVQAFTHPAVSQQ